MKSENIKIVRIGKDSPYMDQVEKIFMRLYDHMNTAGLLMPLVSGGEKMWRSTIESTNGKFSVLSVAVAGNDVIAFAHGQIRFVPKWTGDHKVGYLSHIFVLPQFRKMKIGGELLMDIEKWFKEKNVHSYELQALYKNDEAIKFFEKMGYGKELLQMRKIAGL